MEEYGTMILCMQKLKRFFIPLFFIFLVVASYANSLGNGFTSDDIAGIVQESATWTWISVFTNVKHLTRWTDIIQFFLYQVVGLRPWAYRLVNVLCHVISVLLVYAIVFKLFCQFRALISTRRGPREIAFFAASLFAVHPIIAESVTWISGGIYVQYGMLFLLSFFLYLTAWEQKKNVWAYLFSSYFVFLCSCFFSEKAFILALLFLAYEVCFGNIHRHWQKLIPYFLVSIIFIFFYLTQVHTRTAFVAQKFGGGGEKLNNPLIQIPTSLTSYWELVLWPENLTLYHDIYPNLTFWNYGLRLIFFLGYIAALIVTAIKNRKVCFWFIWFLVPLLPTLTPFQIAWWVAERYAYLSVIGIFVLITYWFEWSLQRLMCVGGPPSSARNPAVCHKESLFGKIKVFMWSEDKNKLSRGMRGEDVGRGWTRKPARRSGVMQALLYIFYIMWMVIILALSVRTMSRNRDWQNEETLWIATARTSPTVEYSWNNMGYVYRHRGDYQKAVDMVKRAISINPNYADAYHNLGEVYRDMGRIEDAILVYEKSLTLNPSLWQSHESLAKIYFDQKKYSQALYHVEEALHIVPDNSTLLRVRGFLQKMQKE